MATPAYLRIGRIDPMNDTDGGSCKDLHLEFRAGPSAAELIETGRSYLAVGATHLIFTCPQPYSAEGARWLWNEVVTPLRG